jgi:hypothetical protein
MTQGLAGRNGQTPELRHPRELMIAGGARSRCICQFGTDSTDTIHRRHLFIPSS